MKLFLVFLLLVIVFTLVFIFGVFCLFISFINESESQATELEFFTSDGNLRDDVFGSE